MPKSRLLVLLVPLFALLAVPPAAADLPAGPGDWPGWRGADRTNLSREKGLLTSWPKGGPKLLYSVDGLGSGYSTVSLVKGRLYTTGTEAAANVPKGKKGKRPAGGSKELLIALDAKDGARLWATPIGTTAGGYPAPRSTPTVDGDRVYVQSSDGKLVCADAAKGEVLWQKDLRKEFNGRFGGWACTESPLVDGDRVVCTPGGNEATLVCLNKADGSVVWKSRGAPRGLNTTAGYSSVIVTDLAGERQYVQFLSGGVVGVSARDGRFLWHYAAPANGTANCSTPLARDNMVFAASAYSKGGGAARVTRSGTDFSAEQVYFLSQMQNHHGGMVLVGDHIYGTGNGGLLCIHFRTGEIVWTNRSVGKGSVVYADGHLVVRSEGGPVALVEATPAGYREKGRFNQPQRSGQSAWSHPVVAGGRLYLRDWDKLLVYDVSGSAG